MSDKGFVISDLCTPRGVSLIIPPFRIHVEREMERIKNFRILTGGCTNHHGFTGV